MIYINLKKIMRLPTLPGARRSTGPPFQSALWHLRGGTQHSSIPYPPSTPTVVWRPKPAAAVESSGIAAQFGRPTVSDTAAHPADPRPRRRYCHFVSYFLILLILIRSPHAQITHIRAVHTVFCTPIVIPMVWRGAENSKGRKISGW